MTTRSCPAATSAISHRLLGVVASLCACGSRTHEFTDASGPRPDPMVGGADAGVADAAPHDAPRGTPDANIPPDGDVPPDARVVADTALVPPDACIPPDAFVPPDAYVAPDAPTGSHIVFMSSATTTGNTGGLSGADDFCTDLASAAGLGGTYRAILSDKIQSLASRVTITGPVYNVDGDIVATDSAAFFAATNLLPNNVTETGVKYTTAQVAWIGDFIDCDGWTNGTTDFSGLLTRPTGTNWTKYDANTSCIADIHLQCISQ